MSCEGIGISNDVYSSPGTTSENHSNVEQLSYDPEYLQSECCDEDEQSCELLLEKDCRCEKQKHAENSDSNDHKHCHQDEVSHGHCSSREDHCHKHCPSDKYNDECLEDQPQCEHCQNSHYHIKHHQCQYDKTSTEFSEGDKNCQHYEIAKICCHHGEDTGSSLEYDQDNYNQNYSIITGSDVHNQHCGKTENLTKFDCDQDYQTDGSWVESIDHDQHRQNNSGQYCTHADKYTEYVDNDQHPGQYSTHDDTYTEYVDNDQHPGQYCEHDDTCTDYTDNEQHPGQYCAHDTCTCTECADMHYFYPNLPQWSTVSFSDDELEVITDPEYSKQFSDVYYLEPIVSQTILNDYLIQEENPDLHVRANGLTKRQRCIARTVMIVSMAMVVLSVLMVVISLIMSNHIDSLVRSSNTDLPKLQISLNSDSSINVTISNTTLINMTLVE